MTIRDLVRMAMDARDDTPHADDGICHAKEGLADWVAEHENELAGLLHLLAEARETGVSHRWFETLATLEART